MLPAVAKILPYINGLVIAIRRLFEWTASMLGVDLSKVIGSSGGGYSDAFDGWKILLTMLEVCCSYVHQILLRNCPSSSWDLTSLM